MICEISFFFKILLFTICFFIFLFFLTFYFQFCLSVLVNKFYKFLCFFILWTRDFIKEFWKIFLKDIDIWSPKFFINFIVYYLFLFSFYSFWHFIFNFVYLYLSTNSRNFYVFSFYGLEILSKNFWKSWNIFVKNIDIWNPKFFINSIVYYLNFFFVFSAFW